MGTVAENIVRVQELILQYAEKYGRDPNSIQLLAASKGQSLVLIEQAIASGIRNFGENYLQEALTKMSELQQHPLIWHFIGPIQSNKTRKIAENFAWVHSVSSRKIAQRLHEQRPANLPPLNICIEINIAHEASKHGIASQDLLALLNYCSTLSNLNVRGLMCIPEASTTQEDKRRAFKNLYDLYHDVRQKGFLLDTLSMGMSNDFEAAIAEGATIIRLGSIIFGDRKK